jgi:hypothetical protein
MFEIRKDIPMPAADSVIKWPFSKMEIGDCVVFSDSKIAARAQTYCHVFGKQKKWKFKSEMRPAGLHVWRIA